MFNILHIIESKLFVEQVSGLACWTKLDVRGGSDEFKFFFFSSRLFSQLGYVSHFRLFFLF